MPAQRRLVDVELVGVDRALHDGLAEPVGAVMNTTSRKPDSVSSVNITPLAPRSLRTMCWTPADSATCECSKPWCTR